MRQKFNPLDDVQAMTDADTAPSDSNLDIIVQMVSSVARVIHLFEI